MTIVLIIIINPITKQTQSENMLYRRSEYNMLKCATIFILHVLFFNLLLKSLILLSLLISMVYNVNIFLLLTWWFKVVLQNVNIAIVETDDDKVILYWKHNSSALAVREWTVPLRKYVHIVNLEMRRTQTTVPMTLKWKENGLVGSKLEKEISYKMAFSCCMI